jgi:hypothetical protein
MRVAVRVLRNRRDGLQPKPHRLRDRRSGERMRLLDPPINVTNIVFAGMGERS